jgi:hypothetical protein
LLLLFTCFARNSSHSLSTACLIVHFLHKQAFSELGASDLSLYSTINAIPTTPTRPKGPLIDSRGRNFLSFSWSPVRPRGASVDGYVVQIGWEKDRFGNVIFQNTCLKDWPPQLGGNSLLTQYATRCVMGPSFDFRKIFAEKKKISTFYVFFSSHRSDLSRDISMDLNGMPMDRCKRPTEEDSVVDSKPLWCCVDGLERERTYFVRVAAISKLGLSDFSPAAELKTRGEGLGISLI